MILKKAICKVEANYYGFKYDKNQLITSNLLAIANDWFRDKTLNC